MLEYDVYEIKIGLIFNWVCSLFYISKLPKSYVLYTLVSRNSRQQKLDKKTSFDEVPQVQLLHIQDRRNWGYRGTPHFGRTRSKTPQIFRPSTGTNILHTALVFQPIKKGKQIYSFFAHFL